MMMSPDHFPKDAPRDDDPWDRQAGKLIAKLANKLAEPLTDADRENDDKTIGEWRREISEIHLEIFEFHRRRRAAGGC